MKIAHDFPFDPTYGYTRETLLQVEPPPEPPGFVDFWKATYHDALRIPLRLESRKITSSHPGFETHEISFDSWEAARIGGWITLPGDGQFSQLFRYLDILVQPKTKGVLDHTGYNGGAVS